MRAGSDLPLVGIPRSLLYYEYSPFWRAFFERLGVSTLVSGETCNRIVNDGVRLSVDESCLPVKVFYGHVQDLIGKTRWLFVPRIVSVADREYTCPKLMGLPDMVREQVTSTGQQLLDATVDVYHDPGSVIKAGKKVAESLGLGWLQSQKAVLAGYLAQKASQSSKICRPLVLSESPGLRIGLLGHRYLIEDPWQNAGLLKHLKSCHVSLVYSEENIPPGAISQGARVLKKPLFWTFERRVIGCAIYMMESKMVDGIVQLASFGCGPDSMVASIIETHARRMGVPYLVLTLDEHTGEAGIVTRIEAFCDMLRWKGENVR